MLPEFGKQYLLPSLVEYIAISNWNRSINSIEPSCTTYEAVSGSLVLSTISACHRLLSKVVVLLIQQIGYSR